MAQTAPGDSLGVSSGGDSAEAPAYGPEDRLGLKVLGSNLAAQGRWAEAVGPLEAALALYREEARADGAALEMSESDLIDQASVLGRLIPCYFVLGEPTRVLSGGWAGAPGSAEEAYQRILTRLEEAADTWYWLGAEAFVRRRLYELTGNFVAEQANLRDLLRGAGAMAAAHGQAAVDRLPLSVQQLAALNAIDHLGRALADSLTSRIEAVGQLRDRLPDRRAELPTVVQRFRGELAQLRHDVAVAARRLVALCDTFYEGYGQLVPALARLADGLETVRGSPGGSAEPSSALEAALARKFELLDLPSTPEDYLALQPTLRQLDKEAADAALQAVREEGAAIEAFVERGIAEMLAAGDVPGANQGVIGRAPWSADARHHDRHQHQRDQSPA